MITIKDSVLEGKRLTSRVSATGECDRYIKNSDFFAEYDAEICDNKSLLNIPLTATVLPLAWLTGSNIIVGSLDRVFKENMDSLQNLFKKMYPLLPGSTEIIAEELVENKIGDIEDKLNMALFFSGGVDSSYSIIKNLDKHPKLVMIWGCDNFAYPERKIHWEKAIETYSRQADIHGLQLYVIKTNISQILDKPRIEHDFYKPLGYRDFRQALQHSLVLLPLAAPLSENRFNHILVAASADSEYDFDLDPYACRPEADEKIVWADLMVSQDGQIRREEKIKEIARYLKKGDLVIRVCIRTDDRVAEKYGLLNDCSCEKCYRTIMNLIQENTDPNLCGFKVDEHTFKAMKKFIEEQYDPYKNYYWKNIQSEIPRSIELDIYGSKEFQEFFRVHQLPEPRQLGVYRDLYFNSPFVIAKYLLKYFYNPLGIHIR